MNAIARSSKLIQPYNAIKELQYIAVASPQLSILLRSYYTHFKLINIYIGKLKLE